MAAGRYASVRDAMMLKTALRLALVMIAVSAWFVPQARAQHKVWRIGFLDPLGSPAPNRRSFNLEAFRRGLHGLGYQEGSDYVIDARFADMARDRLPALARELVDDRVDVIVTIGTPTARAAKQATATIPIVMAGSENPVENGLIASFAHPGGNVTGLTHNVDPGISAKGLQLLKQLAPNVTRVAVLGENGPTGGTSGDAMSAAATELKLTLLPYDSGGAGSVEEFNTVLSRITEEHADAVFVFPNFPNSKYQREILNFVSGNRLPSFFQVSYAVERGGLLSYYSNFSEIRQRAAVYVDKVLKGTAPADLPVEQPSRFELTINLGTARALGLTVPPSILISSDRTFE